MGQYIQTERTAVIAIDLQAENLTDGAWPVENYHKVLRNARIALTACRSKGIPIIYTRHWVDPRGIDARLYQPLGTDGRPLSSVAGSPKAEICREVAPHPEDIVIDKQRFSVFFGTKLDILLRRMDANHLIMFGVWTEACLETSVWDALWRDYRITLVKDACGSGTDTIHKTAILDLANSLNGGSIIDAEELSKALSGRAYRSWCFRKPYSFPYRLDTIDLLYNSFDGH